MQFSPDKILKPADYDTVCSMRDSVMRHSIAGKLLEGVETEVAAIWTDEATGISCKAKIDGLPGDDDCLIDLKSTLDASPLAFSKAIANFSYHRQAAHYLSPFETRDRFIIIACEKNRHSRSQYMRCRVRHCLRADMRFAIYSNAGPIA